MAGTVPIPTAIAKRNLLHGADPKASAAATQKRQGELLAVGDALWEAGRGCESLDFHERLTDEAVRRDRLERVKRSAVARGDAFLLNRFVASGSAASPAALATKDDWAQAARNARASGMLRYALKASIACGDEAQAAELRAQLGIAPTAVTDAARPEDAKAGVKAPGTHVEAAVGGHLSRGDEVSPGPVGAPDAPPAATGPADEPARVDGC